MQLLNTQVFPFRYAFFSFLYRLGLTSAPGVYDKSSTAPKRNILGEASILETNPAGRTPARKSFFIQCGLRLENC